MFTLTSTKQFNFQSLKCLQKDRQTVDQLNQIRKQLFQSQNFESTLRKYSQSLAQFKKEQINFEWQPKLPILHTPTKSQSIQFEIYNWMVILIQNKLHCVVENLSESTIIEQLQQTAGICTLLQNPSLFQQFYDLKNIRYLIDGFINYYLTQLMDANDDPSFYNQNEKTPYCYLFCTTLISLENFTKISNINDKLLNNVVICFRTIQEARMLYLQKANAREIQATLQEVQLLDFPEEIVQAIYKKVAPLIFKVFCTKCEGASEIEMVYQAAIDEVAVENATEFIVWQ